MKKLEDTIRQSIIKSMLFSKDQSLTGTIGMFPTQEIISLMTTLDKDMLYRIQDTVDEIVNIVYKETVEARATEADIFTVFVADDKYVHFTATVYVRFEPTYGVADIADLSIISLEDYLRISKEYRGRKPRGFKSIKFGSNSISDQAIEEGVKEMASLLSLPR